MKARYTTIVQQLGLFFGGGYLDLDLGRVESGFRFGWDLFPLL
jgi:hypothetical protein